MDAIIKSTYDLSNDSFNPRARDGRDKSTFTPISLKAGFNPRARDGRDYFK